MTNWIPCPPADGGRLPTEEEWKHGIRLTQNDGSCLTWHIPPMDWGCTIAWHPLLPPYVPPVPEPKEPSLAQRIRDIAEELGPLTYEEHQEYGAELHALANDVERLTRAHVREVVEQVDEDLESIPADLRDDLRRSIGARKEALDASLAATEQPARPDLSHTPNVMHVRQTVEQPASEPEQPCEECGGTGEIECYRGEPSQGTEVKRCPRCKGVVSEPEKPKRREEWVVTCHQYEGRHSSSVCKEDAAAIVKILENVGTRNVKMHHMREVRPGDLDPDACLQVVAEMEALYSNMDVVQIDTVMGWIERMRGE